MVARSEYLFQEEDFLRLINLHDNYEWLKYEPAALYHLWHIAENETQKALIEELIHKFCFIDGKKLNDACKEIVLCIEQQWGLLSSDTYITAICDNSAPDGSQFLIQQIKNKFALSNGWREFNFYNSLPVAINKVPANNTIVLIDDFIGTGKTIERKYNWVIKTLDKRKIEGCKIKIVSLATMEFAKPILDSLNVQYYSHIWLKKGISDMPNPEKVIVYTKAMEELELKLEPILYNVKLPNFGYGRSETLYALQSNNIPNNVFPLFWWESLKGPIARKTLFKRNILK